MPRISKKFQKIAYNILGEPDNIKKSDSRVKPSVPEAMDWTSTVHTPDISGVPNPIRAKK